MQATEVLVAHHDELRVLLRELGEVPRDPPERRRQALDVVMAELSLHEQIEDEIFYPAMRDVSALVGIAHAEHRQLSDQLAVVLRMDVGGPRFAEELRVLTTAVEHHAGKEESEMFPEVTRKVSAAELEAIGARLAARLRHLRRSRLTQLRLRLKRELVRRL